MFHSTTPNDQLLDYSLLLIAHMVCADREIHNKELKALRKLESTSSGGQHTSEEIDKILTQDEHLISIEEAVQKVPQEDCNWALRAVIWIAHVDGFYSPLEREIVEWVGRIWKQSVEVIQYFIEDTKAYIAIHPVPDDSTPEDDPWDDSDYQSAIHRCAEIAHEDFPFAESALQAAEATLDNLKAGIQEKLKAIENKTSSNAKAEIAKEITQQLETTKQSLEVEICKKIESVQESLDAKKRAINYFTIAFMGKTKAGKSTLHAMMTGEGWDAIGVGKQRTTRLNRVYEWKNIRIIDTPGIGAPGGQTDEEIAQSVIEKSDIICYMVTNDSIQETEFEFLKLLKEKAKPLVFLLNVKYNLRESRRLEHFLNNPDKLFAIEGKSGLGGHIERIRRYAKEHYGNDYFKIIPVMLLAAQMSREPEHQRHKDQLFEASRMQEFFDEIRSSLVEHGDIRRSQTFLGSSVGEIEKPYKWVLRQAQTYQESSDKLKNERKTIRKEIQKVEKDTWESLQYQVEAIFQDALNAIPSFAEDYWDSKKEKMKHGWEQKLKSIRFEERLITVYQETATNFIKEVQISLEEVGRELQLIAKLGEFTFSFDEQDTDDERNLFKIGGGILAVAGAVMAFIPPLIPIGIGFGIVGGVVSFAGNFSNPKTKNAERLLRIFLAR